MYDAALDAGAVGGKLLGAGGGGFILFCMRKTGKSLIDVALWSMCRFTLKAMAVQLRSINRKPVDGFNGSENSGCWRFRPYGRAVVKVSEAGCRNPNANTLRIGF